MSKNSIPTRHNDKVFRGRLLQISQTTHSVKASKSDSLNQSECKFHFANKVWLLCIGAGYPLYGKTVQEFIYACPIRTTDQWPTTLSIMSRIQQNETRSHSIAMPVEVASRPQVKRPLAVCVQAAYGHIDPVRLVEWLEFQRILGVSFVGLHLMEDFSNVSKSVFKYASCSFSPFCYFYHMQYFVYVFVTCTYHAAATDMIPGEIVQ